MVDGNDTDVAPPLFVANQLYDSGPQGLDGLNESTAVFWRVFVAAAAWWRLWPQETVFFVV